jgi:hypothetical protein
MYLGCTRMLPHGVRAAIGGRRLQVRVGHVPSSATIKNMLASCSASEEEPLRLMEFYDGVECVLP